MNDRVYIKRSFASHLKAVAKASAPHAKGDPKMSNVATLEAEIAELERKVFEAEQARTISALEERKAALLSRLSGTPNVITVAPAMEPEVKERKARRTPTNANGKRLDNDPAWLHGTRYGVDGGRFTKSRPPKFANYLKGQWVYVSTLCNLEAGRLYIGRDGMPHNTAKNPGR